MPGQPHNTENAQVPAPETPKIPEANTAMGATAYTDVGAYLQSLNAHPRLSPEAQQALLADFYALQTKIVSLCLDLGWPIIRLIKDAQGVATATGTHGGGETPPEAPHNMEEGQGANTENTLTRYAQVPPAKLKRWELLLEGMVPLSPFPELFARSKDVVLEHLMQMDFSMISLLRGYLDEVSSAANEEGGESQGDSEESALQSMPETWGPNHLQDSATVLNVVDSVRLAFAEAFKLRDRLVQANLRLVISVAKKHCHTQGDFKNNFMDLVAEGNQGLIASIGKYSPAYGTALSTVATRWIYHKIKRYQSQGLRTIRIPAYLHENLMRVRRAVATQPNFNPEAPGAYEAVAKSAKLSVQEVQACIESVPQMVSIQTPVNQGGSGSEGGTITFEDILPQPERRTLAGETASEDTNLILGALASVVESLPADARTTLRLLYNLDEPAHTLQEFVHARAEEINNARAHTHNPNPKPTLHVFYNEV